MYDSSHSSASSSTWSNPNYELISELGRGGMGVVYKARRHSDGRLLAVKVLPKFTSPELLLRFQRETQVLARLEHPHIVKTVDYGEESSPFFAMEFMEGQDLEKLFEDRLQSTGQPFDVKEALELLAPIAEALAYCHSENILHRDIKLANIFINRGGYPVLVDFGVSKQKNEHTQSSYEKTLSKSQEFVGTVAYMSPEQLSLNDEYGPMGPGTDVWSLGTALFQLLTGDFPFPAPSPIHLFVSITENPAPSIRTVRPDLPKWLDRLVLQMLSKQSAERPSMEQVAQTLRNQSSIRPQSARGYSYLWPIALCITATAMLVLAFLLWQSRSPLQFNELTPPPAYVSGKKYILKGQLNQGPVTISIGDRKEVSKVDGRFELSLPLKEGVNLIKITFSIGRGEDLKRSYQIHRDTKAPVIQWSLPGIDKSQSYLAIDDCPSIKGRMIDTSLDSLTVNETLIPLEADQFVIPSALWDSSPDRVLVLRAQDKAGNESILSNVVSGTTLANTSGAATTPGTATSPYPTIKHLSIE
ncbi:MAG: serine/threonine-protein kinase, partial [Planctomycetota bacterium]|nr:serine/threonine-protein kinase [Planctomycetota bacterium]